MLYKENADFLRRFSTLVSRNALGEDMQGASKAQQIFNSGDEAPESGVYTVIHEAHRPNHAATIFKGERFPACAHCGPQVRFALVRPAALISEDSDFQQGPGTPKM